MEGQVAHALSSCSPLQLPLLVYPHASVHTQSLRLAPSSCGVSAVNALGSVPGYNESKTAPDTLTKEPLKRLKSWHSLEPLTYFKVQMNPAGKEAH